MKSSESREREGVLLKVFCTGVRGGCCGKGFLDQE